LTAADAKLIHQRPAVIQELEWRPAYFLNGSTALQNDPVRQILFSFYDDHLSRMVIDYDRDRTAGLTAADMIAAISTAYGPALAVPAKKSAPTSQTEQESGTPIARWGDADYAVVLYRTADIFGTASAARFRLIVASPRLDALARTADAQAIRLDEREAPQREIAREKKEAEDTRASQEKARAANKAVFRP
jgi:hypothetical protein